MNITLTTAVPSSSSTKAARLATATIEKSSIKARRTQASRRNVESMEARARDEGVIDDDGYFTQSNDEFMAETGLNFSGTDVMGLGY